MRHLHKSLNTAHSGCKPSSSVFFFTHSLHVFLPLPTHFTPATTTFLQADTQSSPFLRSTCPNHLKSSIYHTSPPQPCSERPKDCTRPHFTSYPSETHHTSTSPSYALLSPGYADFQPPLPMFQSLMSTHSRHKLWISFPLYDKMHQGMSEQGITHWTTTTQTISSLYTKSRTNQNTITAETMK